MPPAIARELVIVQTGDPVPSVADARGDFARMIREANARTDAKIGRQLAKG